MFKQGVVIQENELIHMDYLVFLNNDPLLKHALSMKQAGMRWDIQKFANLVRTSQYHGMSWDTPEIYQQFCKTDPGQDQFGKTDLGLYITGLYTCYPVCIYLLSYMYSGLSLAYTLVIHEIYLYIQAITCITMV